MVKTTADGYGNNKTVTQQVDVPCIFIQNTQFRRFGFQENIDADAIMYVDPEAAFVVENLNRLEGIYVVAPLFGAGDAQSWYKIETVTVNRDHLLTNQIDNVECRLKKSSPIPGVS
jgi:hypothetical protein